MIPAEAATAAVKVERPTFCIFFGNSCEESQKQSEREKQKLLCRRVSSKETMQEGANEGGMGSVVSVLAQTVTGLQARHSSTDLSHSIIDLMMRVVFTLCTGNHGRSIPAHDWVTAAEPSHDAADER